jgi:hypothetical protein
MDQYMYQGALAELKTLAHMPLLRLRLLLRVTRPWFSFGKALPLFLVLLI